MYKFGARSRRRMSDELHPLLVAVLDRAMSFQVMDFSVIETIRTPERQEMLVQSGFSKTFDSKHLKQSDGYCHAFDVAPYPIDWEDTGRFYVLNGIIRAAASVENVQIRTGADWDNDGHVLDQRFHDLGHYELVVN